MDCAPRLPARRRPEPPPGHTCHHCGATSYHPDDVAEAYCAACSHFCEDVDYWDRLEDVPLF